MPGPTFSSARSSHASAASAGITNTGGEKCLIWQFRDVPAAYFTIYIYRTHDGDMHAGDAIATSTLHDHVMPEVEGGISRVGPEEQFKGKVVRGIPPVPRKGLARP